MENKEHKELRDADDVIRDYVEGEPSQEVQGLEDVRDEFQDAQTLDAGSRQLKQKLESHPPGSLEVFGGDIDAGWDHGDVGEEAVGGSNPTPDQDIVDDIGAAAGLTYQDNETIGAADKLEGRDANRWELNPASAEDYQERRRLEEHEREQQGRGSDTGRGTPKKSEKKGGVER